MITCLRVVCAFLGVFSLAAALKDANHDLVYPKLLSPRSVNGKTVLEISKDMTLYLQKSEVFGRDFPFVYDDADGKSVEFYMQKEKYEKDLYSDYENMASVVVNSDDGVRVEGLLNDKLCIRPVPGMARSEDGYVAHKLYELKQPEVLQVISYNASSIKNLEDRSSNQKVFPEIYFVTDRAHAAEFEFNRDRIVTYLKILLNAVNLRYGTISDIIIQLRIVGVTVLRTDSHLVKAQGNEKYVLDDATVGSFIKYYQHREEFMKSDLMYVVTGLDLVYMDKGRVSTYPGGYSKIGTACQNNKLAMSEDKPHSFSGVSLMAHEIGHALGCEHDGTAVIKDIPGHLGSKNCPASGGYIMTHGSKTQHRFEFSKCCIADMINVISHEKWSCLKEQTFGPTIRTPGLPGQYTSGDKYCQALFPAKTCDYYYTEKLSSADFRKQFRVEECQIFCRCEGNLHVVDAPDGAPCDKKRKGFKRCVLGKCVSMAKDGTKHFESTISEAI